MLTFRCECGAKYRFPESAVGRKARCKHCAATFTLEAEDAGPIPIAKEEADESGGRERSGSAARGPTLATVEVVSAASALSVPGSSPPLIDRESPARGYGENLFWTFLFPSSPHNLLSFLAIWLILGVGGILPLAWIIVVLWYAAFQFAVIEAAASGEEGLPSATIGSDIFADFIMPIFKWMGSWILVSIPALIYVTIRLRNNAQSTSDALSLITTGFAGLGQAATVDPMLFVLVGFGLFLWPMVILCITLGGLSVFLRLDLVMLTIIRAFPSYLLTVFIVYVAMAANVLFGKLSSVTLGAGAGTPLAGLIGSVLGVRMLTTAGTIYCDVVMLTAVGLFYRHFKHRFAWSWG